MTTTELATVLVSGAFVAGAYLVGVYAGVRAQSLARDFDLKYTAANKELSK